MQGYLGLWAEETGKKGVVPEGLLLSDLPADTITLENGRRRLL